MARLLNVEGVSILYNCFFPFTVAHCQGRRKRPKNVGGVHRATVSTIKRDSGNRTRFKHLDWRPETRMHSKSLPIKTGWCLCVEATDAWWEDSGSAFNWGKVSVKNVFCHKYRNYRLQKHIFRSKRRRTLQIVLFWNPNKGFGFQLQFICNQKTIKETSK